MFSTSPMCQSSGDIVLEGHLKKLKTLKKKYFVLRNESVGHPACLEYYDSKKKFETKCPPKRSITVKSCFNINKRWDTKHKFVIALYTKDDCFCLVLESQKELDLWLYQLLRIQNGNVVDGEPPKPIFAHVWTVHLQNKGLGDKLGGAGYFRLCLTKEAVILKEVKKENTLEFPLKQIRRCGCMGKVFYLEVGRSAVTGGGEIWMETEDFNICKAMHSTVSAMMYEQIESEEGPKQRMRSSSANEASKPISVLQRRHTTQKLQNSSPVEEKKEYKDQVEIVQDQIITAFASSECSPSQTTSSPNTYMGEPVARDRCDSLPSRGHGTTSGEGQSADSTTNKSGNFITTVIAGHERSNSTISTLVGGSSGAGSSTATTTASSRPLSTHTKLMSGSPPVVGSLPLSTVSAACSTDSTGSSLSMDEASCEQAMDVVGAHHPSKYGHSLTPDEPAILEEMGDDYVPWSQASSQPHKYSSSFKSCSPSQQSSYVEMFSPSGSSPGQSVYMPMSPATGGHSHSRTSSLVDDSHEGYVPMAPLGDTSYVDMDPIGAHHRANGHFSDDGSSGSVTSGTPSTDLRFAEYHLEKVPSFLSPIDDTQEESRPTRAYSVGSRPEPANRHRKNSFPQNRFEIAQQESMRVRAFSVGSRARKPEIARLNVVTAPLMPGIENTQNITSKSNSAPLLSNSWGHSAVYPASADRMEDLMEMDFSRPKGGPMHPPTLSSSFSQSHSQAYPTATSAGSYIDMSPGQPPKSITASYVSMNGASKMNRTNNNNMSVSKNNNVNNNNNFATANHNQNQSHSMGIVTNHKPLITQASTVLKPVKESESPNMQMESAPESWSQSKPSPDQISSFSQYDYMDMNGPPGGMRTAPVDLPQPRRAPDGYVEMNFKGKSDKDQDYMNMSANKNKHNQNQYGNRKKKCSLPIAIKSAGKSMSTANFHLPLSNSSPIETMSTLTPVSTPEITPTSSSATISPLIPNSSLIPEDKLENVTKQRNTSSSNTNATSDTVVVIPSSQSRKISAPSPLPGVDGCPISKKMHDDFCTTTTSFTRPIVVTRKLEYQATLPACSTSNKPVSPVAKEPLRTTANQSITSKELTTFTLNPITKRLSDLTVSKPHLVTASMTPTASGFKPVQPVKPTSPKIVEDSSKINPTPVTTPTPCPVDNEGYEKLQPGAILLHYAKLDLPEVSSAPPVSPSPAQEGFTYAEIDFAKLKPL
ncbi:mucin-17 isoform X3 [Trichogramma pretiosum]|uniref:mucin-17 isoform X3 n=1 Tax=Trichogramma pretiosum TaxID=7493 RepID=UPI0006C9A8A6|nr:mucin-17 isoform X3 [Trichogramma pretiosum]